MKTLYLNRHAKSSWNNSSLTDRERPLNKRGHINAQYLAKKFADSTKVDLIISSPAVRALTTAQYFAEAMGVDKEGIQIEAAIYGASIGEMLDIVNSIDDLHESAILFGHNPTFESFANYLDEDFTNSMVTCARVKIEFDMKSWSHVSKHTGRAVEYIFPRMYPEMADL